MRGTGDVAWTLFEIAVFWLFDESVCTREMSSQVGYGFGLPVNRSMDKGVVGEALDGLWERVDAEVWPGCVRVPANRTYAWSGEQRASRSERIL